MLREQGIALDQLPTWMGGSHTGRNASAPEFEPSVFAAASAEAAASDAAATSAAAPATVPADAALAAQTEGMGALSIGADGAATGDSDMLGRC